MIIKTCNKCGIQIDEKNPNSILIFHKDNTVDKHLCNYCTIKIKDYIKYGC